MFDPTIPYPLSTDAVEHTRSEIEHYERRLVVLRQRLGHSYRTDTCLLKLGGTYLRPQPALVLPEPKYGITVWENNGPSYPVGAIKFVWKGLRHPDTREAVLEPEGFVGIWDYRVLHDILEETRKKVSHLKFLARFSRPLKRALKKVGL